MTTLPAWAARLLRKNLHSVTNGCAFDEKDGAKILALLAPRRKNEKQRAGAKRKAGAAQAAGATSAEIRRVVEARAAGECEARPSVVDWKHNGALQWDHWRQGSGNRKRFESVAGTWMLCMGCHRRRTHNEPSVEWWNEAFFKHCVSHGYPFTPHVEHAELPGRAAR